MSPANREVPRQAWTDALALNSDRSVRNGSVQSLSAAIRRGADLRILTEFRHNEHIDTTSTSNELIREVCDFQITYLLDDRWVAGIMGLRQPVSLPDRFGPRPSLSFFVYNQDGEQGIARPFLDGGPATQTLGPGPIAEHPDMPRFHQHDSWDADTRAPSYNFVYDFEVFRYFVRDEWHEVLAHDADGTVRSGSMSELGNAFAQGCQVKVATSGLCSDLDEGSVSRHEVFIQGGSCYHYTEQGLFIAGTNPLVRIRPAMPLRYASRGWDFGWCVARSDGLLVYRRVEPYSLTFHDHECRCAMRWFVR